MKIYMRLLSVFLAVLMVCFSFPLSVLADFTADQEVNEAAKTQKVQADESFENRKAVNSSGKDKEFLTNAPEQPPNSTVIFKSNYEFTYVSGTDGEQSYLVSQQKNTVNDTVTGTYNFTYDDMGNITQITNASGVVQNKYYYDDLGQLIREDNRALNKTYLWTYDNAGNILRKRTYAFTTGALGTVLSTQSYTYGNASWGDLLTNVGDTSITYDAIGNPTTVRISDGGESYDYGYNMTWQGRRLMSYTMFDNLETGMQLSELTFEYNVDGIRTSKTVNGVEHKYIVDGSRIVAETWTESGVEHFLVFVYDETGAPIGIKYRASSYAVGVFDYYFFEKNLQGDIIAIYNASGTKIGSYAYDAWGNFTVTKSSGISLLEYNILYNYNPFRYRGYYYDTETGWYYLQSRYYNPTWGRFINADGQMSGVGGDIKGYNLFAYCFNNPTTYDDLDGNWPKWATKLVTAVVVVAVVAAVAAVTVATAGAGTAIAAVTVGAAKGAAAGLAIGASTGAVSGAVSHRISTGSWDGAGEAALNSMADGALSGAIAGAVTGGIQGGKSCISTSGALNPSQIDPRITDALKTLDKTGIKLGQTQISQKAVLEKFNSYNHLTASSSYTKINGNLYVSEGHHTMIANVMKYGNLNSGINMGQMVNDPSVVTNMLWTTLKIMP